MNLVQIYLDNMMFENIKPSSKIKILETENVGYAIRNSQLLEKGKIYEVTKVVQCKGTFNCAKKCTTNCHSVRVKVINDQGAEIEMNTCGCILGNSGNHEFIFKNGYKPKTIRLTLDWIKDGDAYIQTVSIPGMADKDTPVLSPILDSHSFIVAQLQKETWDHVIKATAKENALVFTAYGFKPTVSIELSIKY